MSINNLVYEAMANVKVPWRSGKIKFTIGRTSVSSLPQDCIILNNLRIVANLKPSFLFTMEDFNLLTTPGDGGNGVIMVARAADSFEYKTIAKGTCSVSTYFFGMPKENRLFDWYRRIFETGFRLQNFSVDHPIFTPEAVIDITSKKSDYKHPKFLTGSIPENNLEIPARIRRVK